ncbi:zinc finger CCHC domain-containing 12-like protein [Labeo rohita]|uniref:Zinc finger CCHC domain-containing 12-like protein n=1 Tax=Labeo rohita TaxID=84645 RepID=A0A498NSV4_LABRO|nr:zinc finger CCHC domain-containing 12-like protein [Labeo rohita]
MQTAIGIPVLGLLQILVLHCPGPPLWVTLQRSQRNPGPHALSDVYVQKLGKTTTQTYLSELEALASRSGESFEDVLRGMLAHIHEVVVPKPCPEPTLVEAEGTLPAHSEDLPQTDSTFRQSQVTASAARPHTVPPVSAATSPESPSLTVSDLNPPAVQKVVVEHLVRTSDLPVSGNHCDSVLSLVKFPIHPMRLIMKLGALALNFSFKTQQSQISTEYAGFHRLTQHSWRTAHGRGNGWARLLKLLRHNGCRY